MSYQVFVDRFIHPFIIYVLIGILISYLLALLVVRVPVLRDSRSKAAIYSLPFVIPFIAYFLYRPFSLKNCPTGGHPLGTLNDWLCYGGNALAVILTPLFIVVVVLAVAKAALSIFACRRITGKYGFALPADYPGLFSVLEMLCRKSGIKLPRVIVTKDRFARSFTTGRRSPVIIFSEGLLAALDEEELEAVVAHELGHIMRADSLLNWITVFLRDLMFFNPVVFWVFRDLAAEKEKASDDFAVTITGKPMAFAQALIKVWRLSPRTFFDSIMLDNFMPHPGFVSREGILEHRVKRILDGEHAALDNSLFAYMAVLAIVVLSIYVLYWVC